MRYIIEARRRDSAGASEWDSDCVGGEPYDMETARQYFNELTSDPEWAAFDLRLLRLDEEPEGETEIIRRAAGSDELWGLWRADGGWGPNPDAHQ